MVDRGVAPGTYLYRLAMVDRDGATGRTPAVQVVIGGENGVQLTGVTPNPAATQATVALTLEEAARTTVQVIDLNGRVVATLHDGEMAAGPQTLALDASTLAAGVYTVAVTANGSTVSTQVTIVR